jgi:uncharacterized membrane protein YfcA
MRLLLGLVFFVSVAFQLFVMGSFAYQGHWQVSTLFLFTSVGGIFNAFIGGGGILMIPWAMLVGVAAPIAIGLARFTNVGPTVNSALRQRRFLVAHFQRLRARICFAASFTGALVGAWIVGEAKSQFVFNLVILLLIMAIGFIVVRGKGAEGDDGPATYIFTEWWHWFLLIPIAFISAMGAMGGGGVGPMHTVVLGFMIKEATDKQINAIRQVCAVGFNVGALVLFFQWLFGSYGKVISNPGVAVIGWWTQIVSAIFGSNTTEWLLHQAPAFLAVMMLISALNGSRIGNNYLDKRRNITPIVAGITAFLVLMMIAKNWETYMTSPTWASLLFAFIVGTTTVTCIAKRKQRIKAAIAALPG